MAFDVKCAHRLWVCLLNATPPTLPTVATRQQYCSQHNHALNALGRLPALVASVSAIGLGIDRANELGDVVLNEM